MERLVLLERLEVRENMLEVGPELPVTDTLFEVVLGHNRLAIVPPGVASARGLCFLEVGCAGLETGLWHRPPVTGVVLLTGCCNSWLTIKSRPSTPLNLCP